MQPDINSGMGFTEDDDDDEEMSSPRSGRGGSDERQQAQTASKKPSNDTPVLDNFGTDMTKSGRKKDAWIPVVGRERENRTFSADLKPPQKEQSDFELVSLV